MMGREIRDALAPVAFMVFLAVGGAVLVHCAFGCTPHEQSTAVQSVENAAAVAQYDQALVDCQRQARLEVESRRFASYLRCEQAVTRHFCDESPELRKTWPRCKEDDE